MTASTTFLVLATVLFSNGQTDWKVRLPTAADKTLAYAAEELTNALGRISGTSFPIERSDAGVADRIIAFEAGRDHVAKEVSRVRTEKGGLLFGGNSSRAALYAVYDFLERELGCRWLWSGEEGAFYPERRAFELGTIDRTWTPCFHYRGLFNPDQRADHEFWQSRNRLNAWAGRPEFTDRTGAINVNGNHIVGMTREDIKDHPDMLAVVHGERCGGAGCWSSGGFADLMADRICAWSEKLNLSVVQPFVADVVERCECERCRKEAGDDPNGYWWKVFARIREKVRAKRPSQKFAGLAYQEYRNLPKELPGAKELEFVEYAQYDRCYVHAAADTNCPYNVRSFARMKAWTKLVPMGCYGYEFDIFEPRMYVPFWNMLADQMKTFRALGNVDVKTEACNFSVGPAVPRKEKPEEINRLSLWIYSRLLSDPDADVNGLVADFSACAYGAGGEAMTDYHLAMARAWDAMDVHLSYFGNRPAAMAGAFLSDALIDRAHACFRSARQAVAGDRRALENIELDEFWFGEWEKIYRLVKDSRYDALAAEDDDRPVGSERTLLWINNEGRMPGRMKEFVAEGWTPRFVSYANAEKVKLSRYPLIVIRSQSEFRNALGKDFYQKKLLPALKDGAVVVFDTYGAPGLEHWFGDPDLRVGDELYKLGPKRETCAITDSDFVRYPDDIREFLLKKNYPPAGVFRADPAKWEFLACRATADGTTLPYLACRPYGKGLLVLSMNDGYTPVKILNNLPEYNKRIKRPEVTYAISADGLDASARSRFCAEISSGPVDTVSFASGQPSAASLLKNYKTIAVLGENACDEKQFKTFCDYVLKGGRLVISIPQLSTGAKRGAAVQTTNDLVRCGDFTELCGARVLGRGRMEVENAFAETVVSGGEGDAPRVLRLPNGDGEVWFVDSWSDPGAGLVGEILRRTARLSRGRVYVTEKGTDERGADCRRVALSYFPADGTVTLRNLDDGVRTVDLHQWGETRTVTLEPHGLWRGTTVPAAKAPVWSAKTTAKGVELKVSLDSPLVGTDREPDDNVEIFFQPSQFDRGREQWYYQFFGNVRTRSVAPYWWTKHADYQRFVDWDVDYKAVKGVGYELTVTIPWGSLRKTAPLAGESWRVSVARTRGTAGLDAEETVVSDGALHEPKTWRPVKFEPLDAKTRAAAEAEIAASVKDGRVVELRHWRKPGEKFPITVPMPKTYADGEEQWFERVNVNTHLRRIDEMIAAGRPPRTFLVGDSITGCISAPEHMRRLERFDAVNLGRGGDWIENLHWRVNEGMFDKVKPEYLVMLIGTNNGTWTAGTTAEERAAGVEAVLKRIHELSPKTRILLYAMFPRGKKWAKEGNVMREANRLYEKLCDGKRVIFVDICEKFLEKDGETVRQNYFSDGLHPNRMGCRVWLDSIVRELDRLGAAGGAPAATNEAAILRDMRRETRELKLKVGYPGKFLDVPDDVIAQRAQKYVRRMVELRQVGDLWDVGQESVGYVEAESATRPRLFVGETADEAHNDDPAHFEQTTEMKEVRPGVWRTPLPLALRYIRFGGNPPAKVSFIEEIADVTDQVGFAGRTPREQRMYDVALRTLRLCMRDFLIDGVKRDRLPWAGDLSVSLLSNAYSFRDAGIVRRTLTVLDSAGWRNGDINGSIDYSLWWVVSHDLFQRHFGDRAFLEAEYDRIAGRLESFSRRESAEGLLTDDALADGESWLFIDWTDDAHSTTALNVLYYGALQAGARLADTRGAADDAKRWRERAARLKATLLSRAWDGKRGLFRFDVLDPSKGHFTRHPNIYAAYFNLVDGERLASIGRELAADGLPRVGTPYVSTYEALALIRCGRPADARNLVERIWDGMLDLGATTFWEGFDPSARGSEHWEFYKRPFGKSLCHAWGSAPVFLLRMFNGEIK